MEKMSDSEFTEDMERKIRGRRKTNPNQIKRKGGTQQSMETRAENAIHLMVKRYRAEFISLKFYEEKDRLYVEYHMPGTDADLPDYYFVADKVLLTNCDAAKMRSCIEKLLSKMRNVSVNRTIIKFL